MLQRLQKLIAASGIASRRKAEELIAAGKVIVNSKIAKLGDQADPDKDTITISGKPLPKPEAFVYIILNKPKGCVTTVTEQHGMKTVRELIPVKERIFPVGRLDKDTTGLLLLTNDGSLTQKLTHPSHETQKTYTAVLDKPLNETDLKKLRAGIIIDGREVIISAIKVSAKNEVTLIIHEGRKHIVKRIFEALGYTVKELSRLSIGSLGLGKLKVGEWRYLEEREIVRLKNTQTV